MDLFPGLRAKLAEDVEVSGVSVCDVRFPTSLEALGSDAVHKDPDYSAAYVVVSARGLAAEGHGLAFTLGRGTEVVVSAVKALIPLVTGRKLLEVFTAFGTFWTSLTNETQLRWIGPEKGAVHLAVAGVMNALWDLWAKVEGKPVWKVTPLPDPSAPPHHGSPSLPPSLLPLFISLSLSTHLHTPFQLLCDMTPEETLSLLDFRYLSDALTREEALDMLKKSVPTRKEREEVCGARLTPMQPHAHYTLC